MLATKEFKRLHQLVDEIYDEADALGFSWQEMAAKAGLSYNTVRNLARYNTMYPRTQTVMMLAKAVGFKVQFVKESRRARSI